MTKKGVLVPAVLCALVASAFLPQVPDFWRATVPKVGTIIDHDTGKGIPGAVVVATGYTSSQVGWGGGGGGCSYFIIRTTDENGTYRLPSTYRYFHWGVPGTGALHEWRMFTSKDGYIQANTKLPLPVDAGADFQALIPIWNSNSHNLVRRGGELEIPPIELMQFDATFEQKIAMRLYTGLNPLQACQEISKEDQELVRSINKGFYLDLEQDICKSGGDQSFNDLAIRNLYVLAPQRQKFEAQILKNAPSFKTTNRENTYRYPLPDVCIAMKAGE